jgi:hypothetical protein
MDAPRRVFRLIQLSEDWYWRLDIMRDDGLIGPFVSRDEAEKDAKETLGIRGGREITPRRHPVATKPAPATPKQRGERGALYAHRKSATMRCHVRGTYPYHHRRRAVRRPACAIRRPVGRATLRGRS